MFRGSITALVTPFENGRFDAARYADLIAWQIECGTHAIVPCGSTGESATLSHDEHAEVIGAAVKAADGRVKVIAGTGSNATDEAIELTRAAKDLGANGALLISPYYNKPTQEGVYRHHMKIADEVEIPQILYNVPGRTALDIKPETVARLAPHPNIVGIKEATGSVERAIDIVALCPDGFLLLSGDDIINFPLLAVGSAGSISVTANVWPEKMARMHDAFFAGRIGEAQMLHFEMRELHHAMFIETNPVPVKTALSMMGKMREELRLPLVSMTDANRSTLSAVLKKYALIG